MKIAFTIERDEKLQSKIYDHFGSCPNYLIVELEGNEVKSCEAVENTVMHGGGGCRAVDLLLPLKIDAIVTGGMGQNAQMKFQNNNVKVYSFSGTVEQALEALSKEKLQAPESCQRHQGHH